MRSPFTFIHTAPEATAGKQPAIFLLHGMGSNEEDLPQLVREFKDSHHIFSLRGPIVFDPGYAFFTIEEEGKPIRVVFDEVLTYIQAFIHEAIAEFELDEERIYVLGFSQGAVLAQSLALTMGSVIRGVVALSGYIPDFVKTDYRKQSVDHLNIFISHGEYDYIIPPQWGVESKEYLESLGVNVTFKTYNDGHGVTPENHQNLVEFLRQS
ncbi:MAG TPA: esterase [Sporosarcina psychrophila]|uniref:Esterase n=1 Tax=Sporosarcina psychrophila TaxID=1476 RepID=A0A921KD79_SPOPS|nr:esterase [Sporosarcina psychrophila]